MNERLKPRILHLEDNQDWVTEIKSILGEEYEVVAGADSLPVAVALLDTDLFDLALVDLSLVPSDANHRGGFEFIPYLRRSDLWRDLPVIVFTGYGQKEDAITAFEDYNVFRFLEKHNFGRDELRNKVAEAVAFTRRGFSSFEAPKALVLDDNLDWQAEIQRILEDEGCQVDLTSTYGEAIDLLTSRLYQFATLDVRLQDIDSTDRRGVELADILARLRRLDSFVFITAYGNDSEVRQRADELGAQACIDKGSFREHDFRLLIRRILRHLVYVTVDLDTGDDGEQLKLGKEYPLVVSLGRTSSTRELTRSLIRPVMSGRGFDLTIVVHPYSFDVSPGSTQTMRVASSDSADPVRFRVCPIIPGRIQLIVEIWFGAKMWSLERNYEIINGDATSTETCDQVQ